MLGDYLIYNPDNHEYSIQYDPERKIVVPSVTQLLEYGHLVDTSYIAPHYAEDGTILHFMTELYDQGLYDPSLTVDRVHAAMIGYEQFLLEHDVVWEKSEHKVFHERLFYAGTLDRMGTVDGKRFLVDIKTGSRYRWHVVQVAAYLMSGVVNGAGAADLYLGSCEFKWHEWSDEELQKAAYIFQIIVDLYWHNHPMDYKRLCKMQEELA
jgi:hypothetical protein